MAPKGYAVLGDGDDAAQAAMTDDREKGGLVDETEKGFTTGSDLGRSSPPIAGSSSSPRYSVPPPKSTEDDDDDAGSDIEVFPPQPVPGLHLATMEQKKALWWRNVLITGMFILTWYAFATLLSMYNKWMFSPEYYGFSYPLFVTACHMIVQFSCAAVIRNTMSSRFRPVERPSRRDYATRILPTAWATGSDIGLSNLSLKTITLSLYTMCKSSALIFVLMFAFLFRLEKFSVRLISVIGLITLGVFMMVFNVTEASIPGIIMVLSASAIGGLRWALTELIMNKRAMGLSNPFATIFWLAPPMGVILMFVSLLIEDWKTMLWSRYFGNPLEAIKTIGIIVLPGVLAFAMVASEFFVIQRAGVVPLSVAGIAKEVSTIAFSAWVFGDKLTTLNLIGVVVTVLGIALYSFHKYRKSMSKQVHLDAADNPIEEENDERAPLAGRRQHQRTRSGASTLSGHSRLSSHSVQRDGGIPLQSLEGDTADAHADRVDRLREDFEGWDSVNVNSDAESEADDEEVARRRAHKMGGMRSRWSRFWDGPM